MPPLEYKPNEDISSIGEEGSSQVWMHIKCSNDKVVGDLYSKE